nr:hypothetical protein [Marinobacter sediminum]
MAKGRAYDFTVDRVEADVINAGVDVEFYPLALQVLLQSIAGS